MTEDADDHVVRHRREEGVPLGRPQRAPLDQRLEADLQVHLVVGEINAGGVVDRVGVDPAPGERIFHPTALRDAEVAALGHRAHPEGGRLHADRVVGRVPDLGVALLGGPDVGTDATVEEHVGVERENGLDEPLAAHPIRGEPEEGLCLGRDHDPLRRPRDDRGAARQHARIVGVPALPRRRTRCGHPR